MTLIRIIEEVLVKKLILARYHGRRIFCDFLGSHIMNLSVPGELPLGSLKPDTPFAWFVAFASNHSCRAACDKAVCCTMASM